MVILFSYNVFVSAWNEQKGVFYYSLSIFSILLFWFSCCYSYLFQVFVFFILFKVPTFSFSFLFLKVTLSSFPSHSLKTVCIIVFYRRSNKIQNKIDCFLYLFVCCAMIFQLKWKLIAKNLLFGLCLKYKQGKVVSKNKLLHPLVKHEFHKK